MRAVADLRKESFVSKSIKHFLISKASGYLSSSKGTSEYLKYYGANEPIYIYPFTSSKKSQILKKCNTNKSVIKKQLNIPEEKIVLYTGQFIHRKGIDILLKACVNLKKDCGVYIVGGEPIHEYIDIVQKYELRNIHFIGFKIPSDLKSYYEVADIYVLPTREDVWGLVINEAMAYGIPIITTNKCLAGMELIDDGQNGFIVPVDDVVALSNKINLLLDNRNMRDVMKENNIKKIQDYSIENMAKVHIDIFIDYIRRYE